MNAIIVDSTAYINKKSKIFRRWFGEYSQEYELFQKLFEEYYCRFFPFTSVFFYYIYWSCVWRDYEYITANDFYYDVVDPVQSNFSRDELRWYIKEKDPGYFNSRVSKAIKLLKKEGYIHTKRLVKSQYGISISKKGVITVKKKVLETAWYLVELVDYATRKGDTEVIEKLKRLLTRLKREWS